MSTSRRTHTALALLTTAILSACATTGRDGAPLQVLVPVYYGTDRIVDDVDDPGDYYGAEHAAPSYGVATVALSTRKQGNTEFADWTRWAPRPDARNRNELLRVEPLELSAYRQRLGNDARSNERAIVVYIHGYARKFEEVAINAAILAYELNIDGVPAMFSWPSSGNPLSYGKDVEKMQRSTATLRAFLDELASTEGADTVHVLAHSLGNRGVLESLAAIAANAQQAWKFGEIVLISPDVEVRDFEREYLPVLAGVDSRITLYTSEDDIPLRASNWVNRTERLGDASNGVFVDERVETIVVSDVDGLFEGHISHLDVAEVQADMALVINEGRTPEDRPGLATVNTMDGRYWRAIKRTQ